MIVAYTVAVEGWDLFPFFCVPVSWKHGLIVDVTPLLFDAAVGATSVTLGSVDPHECTPTVWAGVGVTSILLSRAELVAFIAPCYF